MNVVARVSKEDFDRQSDLCCTGWQLAAMFSMAERHFGPVNWYVADSSPRIDTDSTSSPSFGLIGDTTSAIRAVENVQQFESAVFAAVESGNPSPTFRDEAYTDDDATAQLGDSLMELRAFDYTFIEAIMKDPESLAKYLQTGFVRRINIVEE